MTGIKSDNTAGTAAAGLKQFAIRSVRFICIAGICCSLAAIWAGNAAVALNVYSDYFPTLSARPLGMGGAFCAMSGPESVFYNPAGLAGVRQLRLMHNHSARHFPGSTEGGKGEWDQLDGDTQGFTVPLPLSTYAHGFTFSGEMGYDYRYHPDDYSLGYPRDRYWGGEEFDAIATSFMLPVEGGIALRRSFGHFTPDTVDPSRAAWFRQGEGTLWGIRATPWPGLSYGRAEQKMDYEWVILSDPDNSSIDQHDFSSRNKSKREGWALRPAGWLTIALDQADETYGFTDKKNPGLAQAGTGIIHQGDRSISRLHRGMELNIGNLLWLRSGNYDGHPTVGVSLNLLGARLNYAEVESLLPKIVGSGSGFENIHIYGFDLPIY